MLIVGFFLDNVPWCQPEQVDDRHDQRVLGLGARATEW